MIIEHKKDKIARDEKCEGEQLSDLQHETLKCNKTHNYITPGITYKLKEVQP